MSAQIEMNNNEFGSTFSKGGFNAQVFVSEQLNRQLINTTQDTTIRCIEVLAAKFNFDAYEAIEMLGLNMMKLERKAPIKAKVSKPAKIQAPKLAFPLPYNGEFNEACCYALRQNNGLYTQCSGTRKGEAHFCKGCASQMQKVGAETPEYGTIQQRMAVGIFEYVDPKGRKPIAYAKIMKKYKLTEEQVKEEAGKLNIVINEAHFEAPEETKRGRPKSSEKVEKKEKGAKGRPKKSKKVVMIDEGDDDLFAALVAEANEADEEESVVVGKKKGKSDEEKEAERLQKEQEKAEKEAKRLAEKAEKEAKLAAEKAEKEAKKKAEEEARLAKKAAEEAEKKAKKEALEKAKAEKEAKLAAEKEAKEALAKQKKAKKSEEKPKVEEEEEDDEEQEVFQKVVFEGKKYLKSTKTNIVYDYLKLKQEDEQVVVGKWIEADQKLIFNDAEESEDEYDE